MKGRRNVKINRSKCNEKIEREKKLFIDIQFEYEIHQTKEAHKQTQYSCMRRGGITNILVVIIKNNRQ